MKEFKGWATAVLIRWSFKLCPMGKFKVKYALFLQENIMEL